MNTVDPQSAPLATPESATPAQPSLAEAFAVWLKIGLLSFGGPAGQIALMHRLLVKERRWVSEPQFLHALNFCMLLPGPEAQQLASYVGWLMHGTHGGLIADTLFVLPGAPYVERLRGNVQLSGALSAITAAQWSGSF